MNYPTLSPVWMERLSGQWRVAAAEMLGMPPQTLTIKGLQGYADALARLVREGRIPWPPSDEHSLRRTYRAMRHADPFQATSYPIFLFTAPIFQYLTASAKALEGAFGMSHEQVKRMVSNDGNQIYGECMWEHFGKKVLYMESNTFQLLSQTDLPMLPGSFIRPPYQSFYLRFPDDCGYEFTVAGDPIPQKMEGVLVSFDRIDEDVPRDISFLLTARSPDGNHFNDNTLMFDVDLDPDKPMNTVDEGEDLWAGDESGFKTASMVLRLVISTLLYLQSEHPTVVPVPPAQRENLNAIQNPGKRRKAEARNARLSKCSYLYVGSPEPVETVPSPAGKHWRLEEQVWVRGHWRHQAHGPRHSERKLIWIKPFRRGPDVADQLARKMKIQAGESGTTNRNN